MGSKRDALNGSAKNSLELMEFEIEPTHKMTTLMFAFGDLSTPIVAFTTKQRDVLFK